MSEMRPIAWVYCAVGRFFIFRGEIRPIAIFKEKSKKSEDFKHGKRRQKVHSENQRKGS